MLTSTKKIYLPESGVEQNQSYLGHMKKIKCDLVIFSMKNCFLLYLLADGDGTNIKKVRFFLGEIRTSKSYHHIEKCLYI